MTAASQVVILAEDDRQLQLVRSYLRRLGYGYHQMRQVRSPSGRGAGEQWVRQEYPRQVQAYRQRDARARTALVVVIDADLKTVVSRLKQFSDSLADERVLPIGPEERVVHLVPKRHVETSAAAKTLFDWSRPRAAAPEPCLPSLRISLPELGRLEP